MSKRLNDFYKQIDRDQQYALRECFEKLTSLPKLKFTERVDCSFNLGVDARKADQQIRSSSILPHGSGKTVRVAVFAQGDDASAAEAAGADLVGSDDLAEQVKAGKMDFDVVIATPDMMPQVGKLGQILGPRGLMPNPKVGTVTKDVTTAVKNAKGGQVRYRTDKSGIVHASIGNVSFSVDNLIENFVALYQDIKKLKPAASKGIYFKKITVSSTMGPGISVDLNTIERG